MCHIYNKVYRPAFPHLNDGTWNCMASAPEIDSDFPADGLGMVTP
jgi:hypothetical protein